MKRRIISVALALCLCISSHSVAHASQEIPLPPEEEDVFTKDITDMPDAGDDMSIAPENPALPSEDSALTPEAPALPPEEEDVFTEDTTDMPDAGDDMSIAPEDSVLPSEDSALTPEAPALPPEEENVLAVELAEEPAGRNGEVPSPGEAYRAMIALKEQDGYREGTPWTNDEPYSGQNGYYHWKGGPLNGVNISAVGCVAFAFILSDEAFGGLPARICAAGGFSFEDIKAGDILQVNNDAHTVIVLEVSEAGVVVAEGNYNINGQGGMVHWGRSISKEEVMGNTSHYITRYPKGYVSPEDPDADASIASGTLDGGLAWNLTKAGTLTVSGTGAMPDFGGAGEQPWKENAGQIKKVVIGEGVTSIGSCAFWDCELLSAEISSSVAAIGNSAFRGSSLISMTIPSGVKTIGDSAFQSCQNLRSVNVNEGLETICQNAFQSCTSLTSIALPSSIGEVGAAAFFQCTALDSATFAPGSKQVKMGDNLFTQCYYLRKVVLPVSIDRIGKGMFQNCLMLAGLEIPQGAESIGESAFASCSAFTTVIIPDSVTIIERAAFASCPLAEIYFTGSEAEWNGIGKDSDTVLAVSKANIHYNYIPITPPDTDEGDDNNPGGNPGDGDNTGDDEGNTPGGDKPGNNPGNTSGGNKPGGSSGDSAGSNAGSDGDKAESGLMASSVINAGMKAVAETWKPVTPDEIKRYACMGKEAVQCTQSKNNDYPIDIENAMQGPMCFKSFEAVLGDYTIGRTYNIYPLSDAAYSMDKEIQFTIRIPSDIYKEGRIYKMICVTEGGKPFVYSDSDNDPETITIKTNKYHAYALIYK